MQLLDGHTQDVAWTWELQRFLACEDRGLCLYSRADYHAWQHETKPQPIQILAACPPGTILDCCEGFALVVCVQHVTVYDLEAEGICTFAARLPGLYQSVTAHHLHTGFLLRQDGRVSGRALELVLEEDSEDWVMREGCFPQAGHLVSHPSLPNVQAAARVLCLSSLSDIQVSLFLHVEHEVFVGLVESFDGGSWQEDPFPPDGHERPPDVRWRRDGSGVIIKWAGFAMWSVLF